ncbi:Uncharacterised protein [Vibrio cholerae]|nr:Uncharacterised protein [Vibrio cholerae]
MRWCVKRSWTSTSSTKWSAICVIPFRCVSVALLCKRWPILVRLASLPCSSILNTTQPVN